MHKRKSKYLIYINALDDKVSARKATPAHALIPATGDITVSLPPVQIEAKITGSSSLCQVSWGRVTGLFLNSFVAVLKCITLRFKAAFGMLIPRSVTSKLVYASIAEVVDRILDKRIIIDAFIRISLVGIELIAIEVRAVVSSVET